MATTLKPLPATVQILISHSPGEVRTALIEEGEATEAWIERADEPDRVGDLHRGRVTALAPAMGGAFVALADGRTGFLPHSEVEGETRPGTPALQEGMILAVRVIRPAREDKGPRLSARLSEAERSRIAASPGRHPQRIARGPSAAERLALRYPKAPLLTDSPTIAATLRPRFAERLQLLAQPAFDSALEALFESLSETEIALPGGGRMRIEETAALTAIDVDAGRAGTGRDPAALAVYNRMVLPELVRQIRLRNIGGAIVIDFAGLSPRRRRMLAEPLRLALARDPLTRLLGFTHLGLAELLRQRIFPSATEILGRPPSALSLGLAALRRAVREAAARPDRRFIVRARPAVIAALEGARQALAEYRATTGTPPLLIADSAIDQPLIEEWRDGE